MIKAEFMSLLEQLDKYNGAINEEIDTSKLTGIPDEKQNKAADIIAELSKVLEQNDFNIDDYRFDSFDSVQDEYYIELDVSGSIWISEDEYGDTVEWSNYLDDDAVLLDTNKVAAKIYKTIEAILIKNSIINKDSITLEDPSISIYCEDENLNEFEYDGRYFYMGVVADYQSFDGRTYLMGYDSGNAVEDYLDFEGYHIYIYLE